MTNYESIQQVLRAIDQQADFAINSDNEIVALFRNSLTEPDTPLDEKSLWEFYAFMMIENSSQQETWKTYFASPAAKTVNDEYHDRIPIEKITCAVINYWKQRAGEAKHPILKARYAGLVWDFEKKVCGTKPDFQQIAIPYIESLLATVDHGNILGLIYCRIKINRALTLAVAFNNQPLRKAAIQTVIRYQQKFIKANPGKSWLVSYDLLIEPGFIKAGDQEYQPILEWLETSFNKVCTPDNEGRIDLNSVNAFFEPLLKELKQQPEKLNILLQQVEAAYENYIENKSAGEMIHWLEKLASYYLIAGNKIKVESINIRVEGLGPKLIAEMKSVKYEDTHSKDHIDQLTENLLTLTDTDLYNTLCGTFILDPELVMQEKQQRGTHLMDLVSRSLYSRAGRKIATIEAGDDNNTATLIEEMKIQISLNSMALFFVFDTAKARQVITVESLLSNLSRSTIIAENRYPLFKRAFEAWIQRDYLIALHLLIPQIEAACLQVVKNKGGAILKPNDMGGYHVRPFGDLLRSDEIEEVLGYDGAIYFRTLFTDGRGFNLRNEICHGLREIDEFDVQVADATMIGLLHLINCTTSDQENSKE